MKTYKDLKPFNPCKEGLEYAKQFSTLQEAWDKCEDSSWMWWYLRRCNVLKDISAKYADLCADHVKHLTKNSLSIAYAAYSNADAYATYANYVANAAADYAADYAADATIAVGYEEERKLRRPQTLLLS